MMTKRFFFSALVALACSLSMACSLEIKLKKIKDKKAGTSGETRDEDNRLSEKEIWETSESPADSSDEESDDDVYDYEYDEDDETSETVVDEDRSEMRNLNASLTQLWDDQYCTATLEEDLVTYSDEVLAEIGETLLIHKDIFSPRVIYYTPNGSLRDRWLAHTDHTLSCPEDYITSLDTSDFSRMNLLPLTLTDTAGAEQCTIPSGSEPFWNSYFPEEDKYVYQVGSEGGQHGCNAGVLYSSNHPWFRLIPRPDASGVY